MQKILNIKKTESRKQTTLNLWHIKDTVASAECITHVNNNVIRTDMQQQ